MSTDSFAGPTIAAGADPFGGATAIAGGDETFGGATAVAGGDEGMDYSMKT